MSLRVCALGLVAGISLAILGASASMAAQPIREPIVIEDEDFNNLCAFPIRLEITANKEFVKFFSDGRILVNGKLFARVTNMDTGEALDVNISGPAHITPTSERGGGRGILLLFPEDAGGPGVFLVFGRLDIVRGEDGFITNFTLRGRSLNVCAALAP